MAKKTCAAGLSHSRGLALHNDGFGIVDRYVRSIQITGVIRPDSTGRIQSRDLHRCGWNDGIDGMVSCLTSEGDDFFSERGILEPSVDVELCICYQC